MGKTTTTKTVSKYTDSGGGFLLEQLSNTKRSFTLSEHPPIIFEDRPTCNKCNRDFATSWLYDHFYHKCCDGCRNVEEYKLITKTDAIERYLLKVSDLDGREPPLKFITRKNPRNIQWGEMKLYLQLEVERRALEVWGSEEKIEEERKRRELRKAVGKAKNYHKKLRELKMKTRSSLYNRRNIYHSHVFGDEAYNDITDTYTRDCLICPYVETFEKM